MHVCLFLLDVWVWAYACHGLCGSQRTVEWSLFVLSMLMWVPGIKFRSAGLCSRLFPSKPSHCSCFVFRQRLLCSPIRLWVRELCASVSQCCDCKHALPCLAALEFCCFKWWLHKNLQWWSGLAARGDPLLWGDQVSLLYHEKILWGDKTKHVVYSVVSVLSQISISQIRRVYCFDILKPGDGEMFSVET